MQSRALTLRPLAVCLLLSSSLFAAGCSEKVCDADFVLSGALDYNYSLSSSNTECTVTTKALLGTPGRLSFSTNDGADLQILLREDDLTLGSHYADVTFTSSDSWVSASLGGGGESACLVTVTESEFVDWVREDRRRVSGVMTCTEPLTSVSIDGGDLYISGFSFSVYTTDLGIDFPF